MIITSPVVTFDTDTRKITFGQTKCTCFYGYEQWGIPLGHVVRFGTIECDACKGTGRRGSGRCSKCNSPRDAWRSGRTAGRVEHVSRETAINAGRHPECAGTGYVPADRYDYAPREIIAAIVANIPIMLSMREQTWSESFLGFHPTVTETPGITGALASITDHGRRWQAGRNAVRQGDSDRWMADYRCDIRTIIAADSSRQMKPFVDTDSYAIGGILAFIGQNGFTAYGVERSKIATGDDGNVMFAFEGVGV